MEHLTHHYGPFEDVAITCRIDWKGCSGCNTGLDKFFGHGYQPEDFFGFPQRHGWTVEPGTYHLKRSDSSEERSENLEDDEAFIQSWLFFCLISCVVRSHEPLLKISQLIRQSSSSSKWLLDTSELNWAVDEWCDWAKNNPLKSKLRLIHTDLILELARRVVRANLSEGKTRHEKLDVSFDTSFAIMILGETLSAAKLEIMQSTGTKARGWHEDDNEGWGYSEFVSDRMEAEILCPHVRKMLKIQMGSHVTLLMAATKHYPDRKDHGLACTEDRCHYVAANTLQNSPADTPSTSNQSLYQPQCHKIRNMMAKDCKEKKCSMEGPNMVEVCNILARSGSSDQDVLFPLFRIRNENGKNTVSVEAWPNNGRRLAYATISHVWSQGLGNEETNEIHLCQLDHIFKLLQLVEMPGPKTPEPVESHLFWLDTFAIPVKGKKFDSLRKRSIQSIHQVFNNSAHSIVIDKDLCRIPSPDESMQAAMKVLTSGWMRRLWTLQEAFLSKRISVIFDTSQISPRQKIHSAPGKDFDKLIRSLSEDSGSGAETMKLSMSNILARQLRENLMVSEREARNRNGNSVECKGSMLIASAWRSVRWRSTSRLEDETLALATLLNLDLGATRTSVASGILGNSGEGHINARKHLQEMMVEFWQLVHQHWEGSIPSGMIFLPPPRLSIKGFGWSPETWMTGKSEDYPYPLSRMDYPTQLKSDGLLVQYPGIMLYSLDFISTLADRYNTIFEFPIDRELNEWYSVTLIDEDALKEIVENLQKESQSQKTPKRFSLIMPRPRPKERQEVALLVEVYTTHWRRKEDRPPHEVHKCKIITRVWISRMTPKSVVDFHVVGELTDENQHWCVDAYDTKLSNTFFLESKEGTNDDGTPVGISTGSRFLPTFKPFWPTFGRSRTEVHPNDKSEPGFSGKRSQTFHMGPAVLPVDSEQDHRPRNPGQLTRAATFGLGDASGLKR